MFDISFAELMMVAVVGLLVIGPEKLPKVARTLGIYTSRFQRYVSQAKEEVNREMRFEELQALQEEIKAGTNQVKASILDGKAGVEESLTASGQDVKPKRKSVPKKAVKRTATKKPPARKTSVKKSKAKA